MENGSIRNPTQEELEALRKKKLNTNVFKETKQTEAPTVVQQGSVKMKPKASLFEPDPEPYRLITTNNVIKQNLTENHEIFVRRMSGAEDAILASFGDSTNEKILEGITQIISNCTKTDIDLRKLPITEKMPLFIFILSLSLGKTFDAAPLKDCSTCDNETNLPIDIINDFVVNYMPPDSEDYPVKINLSSYEDSNLVAVLEMPKIGAESTLMKVSSNPKDHIDKMTQIVREVHGTYKGSNITVNDLPDIVTYLNGKDKEKIGSVVSNWTENFGPNYATKITTCTNPNCCMLNKEVEFDPYDIIKKYVTRIVIKQKKDI
jgi:hypothetical protein